MMKGDLDVSAVGVPFVLFHGDVRFSLASYP